MILTKANIFEPRQAPFNTLYINACLYLRMCLILASSVTGRTLPHRLQPDSVTQYFVSLSYPLLQISIARIDGEHNWDNQLL